jgi:hypothetical protein
MLQSLKNLLGEMAFVGIRRRKPKSGSEEYVRLNDTVNMTSKVELYISKFKLRLRIFAFKHQVGNTTTNQWLTGQFSAGATQQTPQAPVRRQQINSKFDYNNSMFKVVRADEHQGI